MQKPIPEEFGLTNQEYASLVAERNQLQKAIVTQSSLNGIDVILCIIGALFWGMLLWVVGLIIESAIRYALGKVFGAQDGNFIFYVLAIVDKGVVIVCTIGIFIEMTYSERRKLKKYREQLSGPQYHKVTLYEEAIREYEYRQERYWKSLRGVEFERALERLYSDLGYYVHRTKASCDEGIDLVLQKDNKKIIVQCKGHEKPVGVGVIRDIYGTMIHSRAESAVLACPVGFTDGVIKFANGKPIELLTAKELVEMAERVHDGKNPVSLAQGMNVGQRQLA